jgi:hypothetical protein
MDEKLRKSRKQERDGAVRFGGTVNSQSGAGWIRKGDVTTPTEIVEFKYTDKKSYSLKFVDLVEAWVNATAAGKRTIFGIEFKSFVNQNRWVVMQEDDYHADQEQIVDLEGNVEYYYDLYLNAEADVTELRAKVERLETALTRGSIGS